MKKFLVFLVAIVVVVSLGLTTFYFLRNDEVISFDIKELYINVNDVVTLDDLGYNVLKKHRKTTYNFNAGDEIITSSIEYDQTKGYYVAKAGGDVELKITTSNTRYPEFKINVHIGNGSEENPYYVSNQTDLSLIGDAYELDAHYSLRNDISLTSDFAPIGSAKDSGVWTGFAGTFNGNGYSINGLHLIDGEYSNAGLFSSINSNATVTDLVVKNATIYGDYVNAGVLAGRIDGKVARVLIKNSEITNLKNNSNNGALAGSVNAGAELIVSGADNVNININREEDTETIAEITAIAGGLVGRVDSAKVQAVYANSTINLYNATGKVGGLVGELVLGTNVGSIEESYSISTSNYADFGAFIGTISLGNSFNAEVANKLHYINGNYVVAGSNPVVKTDNSGLFTKYHDAVNAIYFVVGFDSITDLMSNKEYIFYAMAQDDKVTWDKLAWKTSVGSLPALNMTGSNLSTISRDYLMRDMNKENIGDIEADNQTNARVFLDYIESCRTTNGAIKGKSYTLATDIDLTGYDYTAIDLINSVFDGNGKTITIDLTNATNNNLGLFGKVENSTVKNLVINVLGVSNATNVGAVAGVVTSTGEIGSEIKDIVVNYTDVELYVTANNFGGVVGVIDNATTIDRVSVNSFKIKSNSDIKNIGGLVANANNSVVKESVITNSTLYGTANIGGAIATNNSSLNNIKILNTVLAYRNNGSVVVGGIASNNLNAITDSSFDGKIIIERANSASHIGGVAGVNNGVIDNVVVSGDGIVIADTVSNTHYIGGITANNNSVIANAEVRFDSIGSYYKGKNHFVGGVTAINSGANSTISRVVVTSDINGNYVAGIVATMDNGGAKVDQVFVGKSLTKQNIIAGDKMVAGIVYNFVSGEITNIQTVSEIKGKESDTRSSLIVLEFPSSATIKNATINSSLNGNGIFYLDTYNDKTNEGNGANYNVFEAKGCSGLIESVTINETVARKYGKDIKVSEFKTDGVIFFFQMTTYKASGNTNYYKLVNDEEFNNSSTFSTNCELRRTGTGIFMLGADEFSYSMQYDFINSIWSDNNGNGISLAFLKNVL